MDSRALAWAAHATEAARSAARGRAAAWDQVLRSELAFDFTGPAPTLAHPYLRRARRMSLKETIARWLDEKI